MRFRLLATALLIATLHGTVNDAATADDPRPLALRDVLESVEQHYPLLAAAIEERTLADARLMTSKGAFDLVVGAGGKAKPRGFYQTYEGDAYFRQPTTLWGAEFYGGYRIGTGNFAIWNGGDKTNQGGEFRGGMSLPLLRDRAIDDRRASLRKAEIGVEAAEPSVQESVIQFERDASFSYWAWVASGMRVGVARRLLATAEVRQSQLERRVEKGALPQIDLADNERLINDRRVMLINIERAFEQASIDLSLFWRDDHGTPRIAPLPRVPQGFPPEDRPDDQKVQADIERAYVQQPLLREFDYELSRLEVDLELAENRMLPGLAVAIGGSKDVGGATNVPDDKGPAVLEARVFLELPVQRREARGQVAETEARLRQVRLERQFAEERIAAEVRNAMAALRAAFDQVDAARRNVELARKLRKAEERKLLLGQSNLINVNIREVQAADAASTLIAAQADYFRARANYRAALGDAVMDVDANEQPVS